MNQTQLPSAPTLTDLLSKPIQSFSFADIQGFAQQLEPEGEQLDYKKELPKHLAKQLQAFSNTRGGLIIVGVEEDEKNGLPKVWDGVQNDAKLLDMVYQQVARVQPLPTCKVVATNEVGGKVFILIRIYEGDATPYYVENNGNLFIRTGNISDLIAVASPEMAELLYEKGNRAALARQQTIQRAEEVYHAYLKRSEQDRLNKTALKKGGTYTETLYGYTMGTNMGICRIVLQPYFPRSELRPLTDLPGIIHEVKTATPSIHDFVLQSSDRVQLGLVQANMNVRNGAVDCQQIYGNGHLFHLTDLVLVNQDGVHQLNIGHLAQNLYRMLLLANDFYRISGYHGKILGFVRLDELVDPTYIFPISANRMFFDERPCLLPSYTWEIQTDTAILADQEKRRELFYSILREVYWSFDLEPPADHQIFEWFLGQVHLR